MIQGVLDPRFPGKTSQESWILDPSPNENDSEMIQGPPPPKIKPTSLLPSSFGGSCRVYTYIYIYLYLYLCLYICICISIYTSIYSYSLSIYIHIWTYVKKSMCMYIYMPIYSCSPGPRPRTYVRFQREDGGGGSHFCTIPQVLKRRFGFIWLPRGSKVDPFLEGIW